MHTKRLAALLVGMWLAGSLFMMAVAIGNFRTVERIIESPSPAAGQQIKVLGEESARMFLRHQVGEMNRFYFNGWEWVQLGLGIILTVTLLFATNGEKLHMGLCGLLLLLVIIEHFLITPYVTAIGRLLDVVPRGTPSPEATRFWRFHNAYSFLEVLKMLTLVGLAGRLLIVGIGRRGQVRNKVDVIDDADHG